MDRNAIARRKTPKRGKKGPTSASASTPDLRKLLETSIVLVPIDKVTPGVRKDGEEKVASDKPEGTPESRRTSPRVASAFVRPERADGKSRRINSPSGTWKELPKQIETTSELPPVATPTPPIEPTFKSPDRARFMLKQLESTLSPKFTDPVKSSSVHVSRYGRVQKQKENADYIPLDVAKFITKSPPKPPRVLKVLVVEAARPMPVPLIPDDTAAPPEEVIPSDEKDILSYSQIKLEGMDSSFEEGSLPAVETELGLPEEKSSDVDSAKGSLIDVDLAGSEYQLCQLFWGAFKLKAVHWPCMIYPEPGTGQMVTSESDSQKVHVTFFADRGRTAWIPAAYLVPFKGLQEYENYLTDGGLQTAAVKRLLKGKMSNRIYLQAIQEAKEMATCPIESRVQLFQDMLQRNADKPKPRARKRNKSISIGYQSMDGAARSPTPESPMYEALPTSNQQNRSTSRHAPKRIKLDPDPQDQYNNTISRFFQSMKPGGSKASSEISLEGDDLQLELSADVSMLQNGRSRSSHRLLTQALKKRWRTQEESFVMEPDPPPPPKETVKKAPPLTLEQKFVFKLEKHYLAKGLPKGAVCGVCLKPNDVVKCVVCCSHFHEACIDATLTNNNTPENPSESNQFKCPDCVQSKPHRCFVCNDEEPTLNEEQKHRCVVNGCGKSYHKQCLRLFPQHKLTSTPNSSTLFCPYHTCHTCVSDDPRTNASSTRGHLIRCVKCPSSYHLDDQCIPAGSQLLSTASMVCPKHSLEQCSINVTWCFLCCRGGELICCETCPTAFHLECLKFTPPEGRYICEECESGRMPLYKEVVWAKYSQYRFWPALTVPPPQVPAHLLNRQRGESDICVRFFGSHDFGWVNRRRMYLYQDEDSSYVTDRKKTFGVGMVGKYKKALLEAQEINKILQADRASRIAILDAANSFKPPMYVKIKTNRYIPPLKLPYRKEQDEEDHVCSCSQNDVEPCGPNANCLNRELLIECNPDTCPAGQLCANQRFQRKQYPALEAKRIPNKGWGLVAQQDISREQFVIEYVGEVINKDELSRRIKQKQDQKDENYYFLTIDADLTIDAGPRGNLARFINHSCEPNCETLLWRVGGTELVGLFALVDIKAGSELTFNYNFESIGEQKKICHCGATKCSGFIGQKWRPPVEGEPGFVAKTAAGKKIKHRRHSIHPLGLLGRKPKQGRPAAILPAEASGSKKIKQRRLTLGGSLKPADLEPILVKKEPIAVKEEPIVIKEEP